MTVEASTDVARRIPALLDVSLRGLSCNVVEQPVPFFSFHQRAQMRSGSRRGIMELSVWRVQCQGSGVSSFGVWTSGLA